MTSNKKNKCTRCGASVQPYESIRLPSANGDTLICLKCYNKRVADSFGVEYDYLALHPIIIQDTDGLDHTFHLTVRLMGTMQIMDAFELVDNQPAGYQFSMGEPVASGLFVLFSKLYERMLKALGTKYIYKNKTYDTWLIADQKTVQGHISSDLASSREAPLPLIIIDGKNLTWNEFGRMLAAHEGFNFKLQVLDRHHEMP